MPQTQLKAKRQKQISYRRMSRSILTTGCAFAIAGLVTMGLALTLPYWVHVTETMETTMAGLTEDTEVEYYYGLIRTCLVMKATHLDRNECSSRAMGDLKEWEATTFASLIASSCLLTISVTAVLINLLCWNKLRLLVIATVATILADIVSAYGVSLYQINATVQILNIGGLTTANFKPSYLGAAFWLGFTGSVSYIIASICLLVGAFTWTRPGSPLQGVVLNAYNLIKQQPEITQQYDRLTEHFREACINPSNFSLSNTSLRYIY